MIDPEDVKCVKIPEEELTDFEKKKIETFEPPAQSWIEIGIMNSRTQFLELTRSQSSFVG